MSKLILGLQLWSLRDEFAADAAGTLRRVRSLGFDHIETAGNYGWPVERWKELLAETGLTVIGAHLGGPDLFGDLPAQVRFQDALGNHRYIVPWLDEAERNPAGYRKLAVQLNRTGEALQPLGGEVLYHNHEFEFDDLGEGLTGFDILLRETDPARVRFEIDVYWVAYAGGNPLEFLTEHAERIGMVHAKQIRLADKSEVSADAGDIDFAPILALAEKHDWPVALEYEEKDAVEAVRRGAAHLKNLRP